MDEVRLLAENFGRLNQNDRSPFINLLSLTHLQLRENRNKLR
jgi:hypothetical protein